jgi:hypothetical protein
MKQRDRRMIAAAAILLAVGLFALAAPARVFQTRGLSWNAWFASMPGARRLYEGALRVNGRAGRVEVWVMQAGLRSIWGRLDALLDPAARALPGLGDVDGVVLAASADPAGDGLLLLEPGLPGRTVGVLVRPGAQQGGDEPSPEGAALTRAWPAAERVFDAESGRTRLEVLEVPSSPQEALARADSELRGLGWTPTAGAAGSDMRIWLRGREVCLVRAAGAPGTGGSRLALVRRTGGGDSFKE